jgi:ubiquinone/menaquinone biosynthesis C-methylase UbiE
MSLLSILKRFAPKSVRQAVPERVRTATKNVLKQEPLKNDNVKGSKGKDSSSIKESFVSDIQKAEESMKEKDWPKAVIQWRSILETYGNKVPAKAYRYLSRAYRNQGDTVAADNVIRQGSAKHPKDEKLANEAAKYIGSKKEHEVAKSVWESHKKEEYRQDQSHWRGVGRWADDERWQGIGKNSLKRMETFFKMNDRNLAQEAPLTILEWGPGGGANLFGFRDVASRYIGVDISQKNLNEAARMISEEGYSNFDPVLLDGPPSEIFPDQSDFVDVFLSTAVFQHFPSKSYGIEVLGVVHRILRRNGLGLIQIRFDDGKEKFQPIKSLDEYAKKHITANSYRLEEFWEALIDVGLTPFMIQQISNKSNYATFYFAKH